MEDDLQESGFQKSKYSWQNANVEILPIIIIYIR